MLYFIASLWGIKLKKLPESGQMVNQINFLLGPNFVNRKIWDLNLSDNKGSIICINIDCLIDGCILLKAILRTDVLIFFSVNLLDP